MRKIIIALVALLLSLPNCQAENVIQVVPLQTRAGVVADDAECLSFEMRNEEANIVGLSFMVKLPVGMSFDDSDLENLPPFELVLDRYPYTGRGNNKQYQHSVGCNQKEDGWWMVTISSTALNPIKELSGVILQGYYKTDASMQPGVYPILMKDIKLAISGTQKADGPSEAISYVVIGENSPLSSDANLDMSALEGYVPSFVVEAMNTDLAANTNLVSLNLSGATELGAELQVPEDALWYTATQAGQSRVFPANHWSTVCLPFGLSSEQVDEVKAMGVEIEQLSSYSGNIVKFEAVDAMTANEPYIVRSTTAQAPFASFSNVTVGMLTPVAVTKDELTMTGVYEQATLNSDANTLYYIFNAADGKFSRVGTNVTVSPFRAYLQRSANGNNARYIDVIHSGESATGIMEPEDAASSSNGAAVFDLQGRRLPSITEKSGIRVKRGKKFLDY